MPEPRRDGGNDGGDEGKVMRDMAQAESANRSERIFAEMAVAVGQAWRSCRCHSRPSSGSRVNRLKGGIKLVTDDEPRSELAVFSSVWVAAFAGTTSHTVLPKQLLIVAQQVITRR